VSVEIFTEQPPGLARLGQQSHAVARDLQRDVVAPLLHEVAHRALADLGILGRHGQPAPPDLARLIEPPEFDPFADLPAIGRGLRRVEELGAMVERRRARVIAEARLEVGGVDERALVGWIGVERVAIRVACIGVTTRRGEHDAEVAPRLRVAGLQSDRAAQRLLGAGVVAGAALGEPERAPPLGVRGGAPHELAEHAHGARRIAQFADRERVLHAHVIVVGIASQLLAERARRRRVLLSRGEQQPHAIARAAQVRIAPRRVVVRHDRRGECTLLLEHEAATEVLARAAPTIDDRGVLGRGRRRGRRPRWRQERRGRRLDPRAVVRARKHGTRHGAREERDDRECEARTTKGHADKVARGPAWAMR
jgi:hypothetical protein